MAAPPDAAHTTNGGGANDNACDGLGDRGGAHAGDGRGTAGMGRRADGAAAYADRPRDQGPRRSGAGERGSNGRAPYRYSPRRTRHLLLKTGYPSPARNQLAGTLAD